MSTRTEAPAVVAGEPLELTYRAAITLALADAMEADPSTVLLGEDVASAGGVFKTTEGLLERFGRDRVRNTPCSRHRESVAHCVAVYQLIAEQLAPGMTPELLPVPLAELGSNLGGLGADTLSGAVDRLRRAEVLEMRRAHGHPTRYVVTTGVRVSRESVSAPRVTPGGDDTVSALERLYDLHHRGGLTDAQFEEAKNRVLGLA